MWQSSSGPDATIACQSCCTWVACFRMWSSPDRQHLSVSLPEQAAAKALGPRGWSFRGNEDFTPTPGFSWSHGRRVTKSCGCESPAAVLFQELTWQRCNVWAATTPATFDSGTKLPRAGLKMKRPARSSGWRTALAAASPGTEEGRPPRKGCSQLLSQGRSPGP